MMGLCDALQGRICFWGMVNTGGGDNIFTFPGQLYSFSLFHMCEGRPLLSGITKRWARYYWVSEHGALSNPSPSPSLDQNTPIKQCSVSSLQTSSGFLSPVALLPSCGCILLLYQSYVTYGVHLICIFFLPRTHSHRLLHIHRPT